jgi:hypothetical protein
MFIGKFLRSALVPLALLGGCASEKEVSNDTQPAAVQQQSRLAQLHETWQKRWADARAAGRTQEIASLEDYLVSVSSDDMVALQKATGNVAYGRGYIALALGQMLNFEGRYDDSAKWLKVALENAPIKAQDATVPPSMIAFFRAQSLAGFDINAKNLDVAHAKAVIGPLLEMERSVGADEWGTEMRYRIAVYMHMAGQKDGLADRLQALSHEIEAAGTVPADRVEMYGTTLNLSVQALQAANRTTDAVRAYQKLTDFDVAHHTNFRGLGDGVTHQD